MKRKYENKHDTSKFILFKHKFLAYIVSLRQSGWLIAAAFFLLGEWYAIQGFPLRSSILALCAIAGIGSSASLMNHVYDKEIDIFSRKQSIRVFKYISPEEMLIVSVFLSLLSLILLWCINIPAFIIGLLLVLMSILYSAPPFRFKTTPPFDPIPNALGQGTLPFFLGWLVVKDQLTPISLLYGIIFGLICLSGYLYYASLDIKADKEQGIETSCTKLGLKNTINVGIVIFFISLILVIIFIGVFSLVTISFVIVSPLVLAPKFKRDISCHLSIIFCFLIWMMFILFSLSLLSQSIIPISMTILTLLNIVYICFFHQRIIKSL